MSQPHNKGEQCWVLSSVDRLKWKRLIHSYEAWEQRRSENYVLYIWSVQFKGYDRVRHFLGQIFSWYYDKFNSDEDLWRIGASIDRPDKEFSLTDPWSYLCLIMLFYVVELYCLNCYV